MDRSEAAAVARRKMMRRPMGLRRKETWMHPWQLAVHLVRLARWSPSQRDEVDAFSASAMQSDHFGRGQNHPGVNKYGLNIIWFGGLTLFINPSLQIGGCPAFSGFS